MNSKARQPVTIKRAILGTFVALTLLSSVMQVPIDASIDNIVCLCWVLASTFSILLYIGYTRAIEEQPLSTFSILGFCVTTQLGALLAQTAAWTPLRSSLYDAPLTFSTLAIYQGIAMFVHAGYCFFSFKKPVEKRIIRGVLAWIGVYETPSAGTLWVMGYVGLLGWLLGSMIGVLDTRTWLKVADGFRFLAWAPFLIPVYYWRYGPAYCNSRLAKGQLVIFSIIIVFIGMGLNFRQIMFFGIVTIALLFLLFGLRSNSPVKPASILKITVAAAAMFAVSGPISDLATAMVVARQDRGKISEMAMISNTIDVWMNRRYLIDAFRADEKAQLTIAGYDESYIANPLLARFIETKFHDNSLHFAGLLTDGDIDDLKRFTIKSLWEIFPMPLLNVFGIVVDKNQRYHSSLGDYLAYLSRGIPLGGLKTGSVLAQGRVLMGPLFPFVYGLMCLVLFAIMDLLTVRSSDGPAFLCAIAMMNIWQLFIYGITCESFEVFVVFCGREVPQMTIIYCSLLGLCKILLPSAKFSRKDLSYQQP